MVSKSLMPLIHSLRDDVDSVAESDLDLFFAALSVHPKAIDCSEVKSHVTKAYKKGYLSALDAVARKQPEIDHD